MARTVIVDDNRGMRLVARIIAEEAGCHVIGEAETGDDGVWLAVRRRADVVVMDYMLPDIDGATATARIMEALPSTRVVAWTSSDDPRAAEALREAGARAVIDKRDLDELADVLRSWAKPARTSAF